MTAPDNDSIKASLLSAAAVIERKQFVTTEIARLQAELVALDAIMAGTWPPLITEVAASLQALAQQAGAV